LFTQIFNNLNFTMDTEEYQSDSAEYEEVQSEVSDEENDASDDEDSSDQEGSCNSDDYQLQEEQDLRDLELEEQTEPDEKKQRKGKRDVKQSVITRSTKQAFVNYLKKVSKPSSVAASSTQQILKVVHQLVKARGFTVIDNTTKHKHLQVLASSKKRTVVGVKGDEILCVFFTKSGKLGVQAAREIEQYITKFGISQVVIITTDGVTPVAMKSLLKLTCLMHFFQAKELTKKYPDHALIPKQYKLSEEDSKKFLKDKKTTLEQMPRMSRVDPIAKYYGWPPGCIIKSVRQLGGSAEPYMYWRAVF